MTSLIEIRKNYGDRLTLEESEKLTYEENKVLREGLKSGDVLVGSDYQTLILDGDTDAASESFSEKVRHAVDNIDP